MVGEDDTYRNISCVLPLFLVVALFLIHFLHCVAEYVCMLGISIFILDP